VFSIVGPFSDVLTGAVWLCLGRSSENVTVNYYGRRTGVDDTIGQRPIFKAKVA
jgi:hypothetical protein